MGVLSVAQFAHFLLCNSILGFLRTRVFPSCRGAMRGLWWIFSYSPHALHKRAPKMLRRQLGVSVAPQWLQTRKSFLILSDCVGIVEEKVFEVFEVFDVLDVLDVDLGGIQLNLTCWVSWMPASLVFGIHVVSFEATAAMSFQRETLTLFACTRSLILIVRLFSPVRTLFSPAECKGRMSVSSDCVLLSRVLCGWSILDGGRFLIVALSLFKSSLWSDSLQLKVPVIPQSIRQFETFSSRGYAFYKGDLKCAPRRDRMSQIFCRPGKIRAPRFSQI